MMNQKIFKLSTHVAMITAMLFLSYCYPRERKAEFNNITALSTNTFDVKFYDLSFDIDINNQSISAKTVCKFQVLIPRDTLYFDLKDELTVNSVIDEYANLAYFQKEDKLGIVFNNRPRKNQIKNIEISYSGKAQNVNGIGVKKGLVFGKHNKNEPIIATLSTPFLSHYWFPCKDDIADKADSVHIDITIPNDSINGLPLTVASNGKLKHQIVLKNKKKLFRWTHNYPIASCYVFFAISNYKIYKEDYIDKFDNKFPITLYAFEEDYQAAVQQIEKIKKGLDFFTDLFGPYPFINEGFGLAQIGFYSGIETQTCPIVESISDKRLYTLIHELSHAWFANSVTAKSWQDAWLHEGFATYSEALYLERVRGKKGYLGAIRKFEYLEGGTIYAEKTDNPFQVFSGIVYNKGAFTLHSLRGLVGDDDFFKILKTYYKTYQYKNVKTADFKAICETISGKDLGFFFDQWIYKEGNPKFYFSYYQNPRNLDITLNVRQTQVVQTKQFFNTPIELYLDFTYKDSIVTIQNTDAFQKFIIPSNQKLENLDIDPNNWILKEVVMKKEIIEVSNNSIHQVEINSNLSGRSIDILLKSSKRQKAIFRLKDEYNRTVLTKSFKVAGTSLFNVEIPRNIEGGFYNIEIETKYEKYHKRLTILD